ncbi:MAG: bifunctional UDP-N-acetylglucosamine diphosphorylase/glucosamine-1-phosphate N-acetyltransferase GlmU [Pseudomonadota bacterium]
MSLALIVLAAGQGTRMKSDLPKVLHKIGGASLMQHALRAGASLEPERIILVTGHGAEQVEEIALALDPEIEFARQSQQKGTGHAVAQAAPLLADFEGDVAVLYADTPFITSETLARLKAARGSHDIGVLGFEALDPGRYGRLVMKGDSLEKIVEYKEADAATRAITFCNSGIMVAPARLLFALIDALCPDNAAGEYYLTDVIERARAEGLSVTAVSCSEDETLGVNSRAELAQAEAIFQHRARAAAMAAGVTMTAPDTVYLSHDTRLGRDIIVEPHVVFGPGVQVDDGTFIRSFSHLEGCDIGKNAVIGPYARLRPGASLGDAARIGNFVELKNADIGAGAKVNHLSYVGDARVGSRANIGAGTITCNYDGVNKHHTDIGANAFIGSNTMLVAPVSVGRGALTASGSVITKDVPDEALAIARARQDNKPGLARRFFEALRSRKVKSKKKQAE